MAKAKKKLPQRSVTSADREIGTRLRMRRVDIGLSQDDLGKKLGLSFQQIQKYEKGLNRVSGNRLRQLCEILEIDPNYLLGWQGKAMKLDELQTLDSLTYKTAALINSLPDVLREPFIHFARKMQELAAQMK